MAKEILLLAGVGTAQAAAIRRIAGNMRIAVSDVPEALYGSTLGDIYDGKVTAAAPIAKQTSGGSLLIFANVSDKHMDKILFEMRNKEIVVDFKAVMTDTNRQWTIKRLLFEMEREKQSFARNTL